MKNTQKDLRLEIRVKNNVLFTTMQQQGLTTATALSKACGVSQPTIGRFLNLKESPRSKKGGFKQSAKKIATTLSSVPEILFPDHLYQSIQAPSIILEVSSQTVQQQVHALQENQLLPSPQTPFEALAQQDKKITIRRALATLLAREESIIRKLFGIGEKQLPVKEIAKMFGVEETRIRQIERKALEKLRHPMRKRILQEVL